jgi:hypothetical protein
VVWLLREPRLSNVGIAYMMWVHALELSTTASRGSGFMYIAGY